MGKKFIRIIALVIINLMLITTGTVFVSAETIQPTLSQTAFYAVQGETFTTTLYLTKGSNVCTMKMTLTYNPELVTLVSCAENADSIVHVIVNTGTNGQITLTFAHTRNISSEVGLVDVTFKVNDYVGTGTYDLFTVSGNDNHICRLNSSNIAEDVEYAADLKKLNIYKSGDINLDGVVDGRDAVYILRYAAKLSSGSEGSSFYLPYHEDENSYTDHQKMMLRIADAFADGSVTGQDAVSVLRYAAGFGSEVMGSRVDIHFMGKDGSEWKTLSVPYGSSLTNIPEVPSGEGFESGTWMVKNTDNTYSVADFSNITSDMVVYAQTVIPPSHKLEHYDAKAPSTTEQGWNEHWKCSVCGKYFANSEATEELTENQVFIEPIKRTESTVIYNVYGSDPYLESIGVDNSTNKTKFYSEEGMALNDLKAPAGYIFKGWTTASGEPISEIKPSAASRQIVVNANWEKTVYRVIFDTPDVPVNGTKINGEEVVNYTEYTVDTGTVLKKPYCYGYTFVGWSNDEGFIVDRINPGTTGTITLHANWTSNRNRATSYSKYGAPIIIEDDTHGQFLFVYDIGRIDNVPLYTYLDSQGQTIGANGTALNIDMTYEVKEEFNEKEAKEIIKTVADATTRSSGWTLSEEWNDLYKEGTEYTDKHIKTEERTDSQGNVIGGNYFVSNSKGGSSFVSTECGGSTSNSSKVTTDKSFGINSSYDKSTEKYCDAKLSVENKTEVSAGVKVPVGIAEVSAGVKNTTTIGAEVSSGRKDKTAFHVDGSYSSSVGTVDLNDSSSYFNTTANQSSNWNSTSGYEKSYQTSTTTSVSQAIADEIAKTTNYSISKSLGGGSEHNTAISGTSSTEEGYSNSIQVEKYFSKSTEKHVKYSNPDIGYYRVVMAGTVHVYGVVGYDVATASYYTYTYNVLADDTFEYVDYSKERATFDDCENGIVTFKVPYEVNEYILGVTSETEGLEIGLDGVVNAFDNSEDFDGTVVVPQYHAETQPGTDNVAIKTKAISSTAFRNNTKIEKVILPVYVNEIPEGAFEGCTNLKTVIAYGVTKIGKDAFKGCVNLGKFYVDNYITELGENAFQGVPELGVMAHDSKVADAAIKSGAKRITVDISRITDNYNNKVVSVGRGTDYFAIIGNGGEYENLQIKSEAKETLISKIIFVKNNDIPLDLGSETVTLSVVSVKDSPVYALHLSADNTALKLYGEINLDSQGDNTVISKNVTLSKANNNITSKLNVSGGYLVYGDVVNREAFLNVKPETISATEYEMYTSRCVITFDTNEGTGIAESKTVYKGQKYGTLPTPQKEHYEFVGWYTAAENGSLITADSTVNVEKSQTLYAHWKRLTSTIAFDANGGSVPSESKAVYIGEAVGNLPVPERTGCTFLGWYRSDGTQLKEDDIFNEMSDITVKAHWQSADWVLESEVPVGAEVTSEKWTYDLTTIRESDKPSEDGFTLFKTTSTWSDYGPWSQESTTPVTSSDSRQVSTRVVPATYKTQYNYSRWSQYSNGSGNNGPTQNTWGGVWCGYYKERGWTDTRLDAYSSQYAYGMQFNLYGWSGETWYNETTRQVEVTSAYTLYKYRDRKLIYKYYHKKTEEKESETEVVASDTISNVQKKVKYVIE